MKSRGFTLLELMVVVSIVGLLAGSFVVSSGTTRRKSRDQKRKADLLAIQSALEFYFAQNKFYPANCSTAHGVNSGSQASSTTAPAGLSQGQKDAIWPKLSKWINHAPNTSTNSIGTPVGCPTNQSVTPILTQLYINSLPVDPQNTGNYVYRYRTYSVGFPSNGYGNSANQYELDALLEVDTAAMINDGGNCNGPPPTGTQYRYELFNYNGIPLPCS